MLRILLFLNIFPTVAAQSYIQVTSYSGEFVNSDGITPKIKIAGRTGLQQAVRVTAARLQIVWVTTSSPVRNGAPCMLLKNLICQADSSMISFPATHPQTMLVVLMAIPLPALM